MPITAGILDLFCCSILLLLLIFFLIGGMIIFIYYPYVIAISIIAGLLTLIGGVNTLNKKSWIKSLMGSFSILFIFSPFLLIQNYRDDIEFPLIGLVTLIMGIIAIVLTILSRDQFERK